MKDEVIKPMPESEAKEALKRSQTPIPNAVTLLQKLDGSGERMTSHFTASGIETWYKLENGEVISVIIHSNQELPVRNGGEEIKVVKSINRCEKGENMLTVCSKHTITYNSDDYSICPLCSREKDAEKLNILIGRLESLELEVLEND